ncbi:sensory box histidine kinase, partial [mine drainage metagenome]
QLQVLNHELEAFSYSVSHDLRSPLRAVDGFSQALVEDCGRELSPEAKRYLERIQMATRRMGALIDDLIALARVSRSELNPERIDLSDLTTEIIDELRERDPSRMVSLELMRPLWTFGDRKLMRVALVNLLHNAWKFTSKRELARIRVGQLVKEEERPYFIQDNGAGFDMTYAGKLFSPFQRLHDSREFEGTGIGLATVQRIVTRHGGRIWVHAEPENGATFYFTLPGE